jgi:hypothetical protein
MAFNPFHKFRKHQKVIFACLTIMCMLTFVACTGVGGDFAGWLQGLLVGRGPSNEVASVNGSEITQRELITLARQREIANIYMREATKIALDSRLQELRPPGAPQDDLKAWIEVSQKAQRDPECIVLQNRFRMNPYFGGKLNGDGLLEFKIWLHQADALGIRLTPADVNKQLQRLTLNRFRKKPDSGYVEAGLKEKYRDYFTSEVLIAALTNELRVQMAQAALLGLPEPSLSGRIPPPVTPQEFWEFYKDNFTRLDIRLLALKVEDFLPRVDEGKEAPKDAELQTLFNKYKDREYAPDAKEPGFKVPRRIQVEWLSGQWESPYYKKAAADYRVAVRAALQVGGGVGDFGFGAGVIPSVQIAVPTNLDMMVPAGKDPLGKDTTLLKEYENMRWQFQAASYARPWRWSPYPVHDANLNQPGNVAAAVGAAGSDVGGLSGYAAYLGSATAREQLARVERGTTWLLSGAQPTPLMALGMTSQLSPGSEYLPLEQVKPIVEERLQMFLAQDILAHDLRTILKEIETKGKGGDKEKKELAEYLGGKVKEGGLQTGKTSEPRDLHKNKIGDDASLKPLRDAYVRDLGDPEGRLFAEHLFFGRTSKGPYQVEHFPRSAPIEHDSLWKASRETFLYWKTEDQAARTGTLEEPEVRKEVERAWKMEKARELARKEADQLAGQVRELKGDVKKLRDLSGQQVKKEPIELPPLSKLIQRPIERAEFAYQYEAPQPHRELARIPYPTADFATKLLGLKDKEKGEVVVVVDQPETTFYIAVLVERTEPTLDAFFRVYRDASSDSVRRDPLLDRFERERQMQYQENVIKLLEEHAKLRKNPEMLKGFEGSLGSDN